MSEMIERMAERMEARFKSVIAESAGEPFEATKVALPDRVIFRGYAAAAIEAMREPTEAMLDAALSVASWEYELDERKQASVYWPAMIDEALK